MLSLSIIIPVYNEERTVAELLDRVWELPLTGGYTKQVIVVDDASRDGSNAAIRSWMANGRADVLFLTHEKNKGKGGAIHTGLKAATGDFVVIQDADLELDPSDINRLLDHAITHQLDVVYGSRFLNPSARQSWSLSLVANKFLTWLTGFLVGKKITDMETCYKLMRAHMIKSLSLVEQRFGFEPEITMKLLRKRGIRFGEIAIRYQPRTHAEGKKIGWKDGVRAMWCLVKYRFS